MTEEDDKFILMKMDDERSKQIAEVLGNKTCKKILDYLAETKEASEQDISNALKIPLNTTEYNLNKLVKAGLVEKAKNYFWSIKGKRIDMYKLAKKHIVISPKTIRPSLTAIKTIIPIIIAIIGIAIIASLFLFPEQIIIEKNQTEETKLKQFSSYAELKNFIKENSESARYYKIYEEVATGITAGAPMAAKADLGAAEFSKTNIQVEGVDEPDIVKNDEKYIYTVNGNKVIIVDAYPVEDMKILSEINFSNDVDEIFINEDKLIVFSQGYQSYGEKCVGIIAGVRCGGYSESETLVYIYDVSDKENPVLEDEISGSGYYVDSRMIGNYVYVISSKSIRLDNPILPVYEANGIKTEIAPVDVYYFDYPDTSYVFTSVMAINVKNREFNSKIYLTGSSRTLYVSIDNIYLTYQKRISYKEYLEDYVKDVALKVLPDEYENQINEIVNSEKPLYQKLNQIQTIITEYSLSLRGDEKSEFDEKLMNLTQEFQIKIQKKSEKTVVHKIKVDKENINYKAVGEVPGTVLNQFSMDEHEGYFRIATTTGDTWQGTSLNHLYVLDEDLKIVGSVEDLAKGERIYSARFLGEKAYIVTFKKIDPLFVIDLSNPSSPKILGYLKITGYSDYLHPYDENHIIGIGKETAGGSEFFSWYQGIKISLFDVTDVKNPVEKAKYEIGDRGTDSDVLREHKAFLFDKERNLLVMPIRLYEINESKYLEMYGEIPDNAYGEFVWQGAYVLNINLDGINLRGKVSHDNETAEKPEYYYGNYQTAIKRSLYMDDILYTISLSKIKANNLQTIDKINSLNLPYKQEVYPLYETGVI